MIRAFRRSSGGYSADRVVADPELDREFLDTCAKMGLERAFVLNRSVFRLRKAGKLQCVPTNEQRTDFAWEEADDYLFASEIAWRQIRDQNQASLDDILLPIRLLADQFDQIAEEIRALDFRRFSHRWGARKRYEEVSIVAGHRSNRLSSVRLPASWLCHDEQRRSELDDQPGLYMVYEKSGQPLYAGETFDLGKRLKKHFGSGSAAQGWLDLGADLRISAIPYATFRNVEAEAGNAGLGTWLVACQYLLVKQESPSTEFARAGFSRRISLVPERNFPLSDSTASSPDESGPLSMWDSVSLIVGIVIGSSIYRTPGIIFSNVADPWTGLCLWILCGGLSLAMRGICYAELATTYPQIGAANTFT